MQASAIEFRLRMLIIGVILALGFWAPWIERLGIGQRSSLLEWLALHVARVGLLPFTVATPAVILAGSLVAAIAVLLRVTGTAYLGPATVLHPRMQAAAVTASGPYRFVRNPLYLGLWFMTAAMALIMPPTGALAAMALVTLFLLRLTLGEEAFLNPARPAVSRLPPRRTAFHAAAARVPAAHRRKASLAARGFE